MPAPYQEAAADLFDYATDWKEVIDSSGAASPCNSHLSNDAQEATLVGYVPWNKQRSAARWFLGFATVDDASPWRMYRENPQPHPTYPWLYAYDVSFTPYLVKSNPDAVGSAPKIESVFDPTVVTAYHDQAVCTVRFRNFRCDFLEDALVSSNRNEWKRNTYFDVEPTIEALQCTGGLSNLTFAESGGAGSEPVAGTTKFGAPVAQLLAKTGFTLTWLNVPWEYLSNADYYFYPSKILRCVGTVNSENMFDDGVNYFRPGTLLFQPPRWSIKTAPVASETHQYPLRFVDLVLRWDYFEPSPKGVLASAYHGHVLMPWAGDGTAAKPGNGKWYFATRNGATTGTLTTEQTVIPYADHRIVFENINE